MALLVLLAVSWFSRAAAPPAVQETVTQSRLCQAIDQVLAGAGTSPIELITYSDFQCPRCRELNDALIPVRQDPRLNVIHRHSPLERECNPMMTRAGHKGACLQARAAICAGAVGRYDEFSDALFGGVPPEETFLVSLAASLGIELDSFRSCLHAPDTARRLEADVAAAMAHGIQGTPTLIVNGSKHTGRLAEADLACLSRLNDHAE